MSEDHTEYEGWEELEAFIAENFAPDAKFECGPQFAARNKVKPGTYTWTGKEVMYSEGVPW